MSILIAIIFFARCSISSNAAFPLKESDSESASQEAEEYYNKLPQGVRDAFESGGWKVIITDIFKVNFVSALYNGVPSGGYSAGYTEFASKSIVLTNTDAAGAMNHEIGHYFDYMLAGQISSTDSFISIYNDEKTSFDEGTNDYAMSDPAEYFAEAFREYIECAGYLKKCCPSTYTTLNNLVSPYGGTQTDNITYYTRADSHLIKETAKTAANKMAKIATKAANVVLSGDKNAAASRSLDEWLEVAKDTYSDMKSDPSGWASSLADRINQKISDSDPEELGKEVANGVNKKVAEWNEKVKETDWEQKGRDISNKIGGFLEGMNP